MIESSKQVSASSQIIPNARENLLQGAKLCIQMNSVQSKHLL